MKALLVLVLASCSIETGYEPPPPPPWGAPISGGTMIVTRDGNHAVVADPDRDRVVIVDLVAYTVTDAIELAAGSEPGRVADDATGRIHVVLRGSGELLTITGAARQWRPICGEPRGLAWDPTGDLVHVACATGELVSVPAGGGDPVRVVRLDRDLRDVIVRDSGLAVTTFRAAEILELDAQGTVVSRTKPPVTHPGADAIPSVAWRTVPLSGGRMLMSHQRRLGATLKIQTGGYGGQCHGRAVESSLTVIGADGTAMAVAPLDTGALPVDVAAAPAGDSIAVVSAGQSNVLVFSSTGVTQPDQDDCTSRNSTPVQIVGGSAVPTSVAYRPSGALLVFYPEESTLAVHDGGATLDIALGGERTSDRGRTLFHEQTPVGIACASCHPEARDDGGVWTFEGLGVRRTQSLAGNLVARAPYHWSADMPSLYVLVDAVFADRMSGGTVEPEDKRALTAWLDRIRAPRGVVVDAAAVLRGAALFQAPEQGCTSCHSGALYTNNRIVDVGTYGNIKVPSLLGVGARAPYLHDGCAATLRDRFGVCGGGDQHGRTSHLSEAELADLIAYLESL